MPEAWPPIPQEYRLLTLQTGINSADFRQAAIFVEERGRSHVHVGRVPRFPGKPLDKRAIPELRNDGPEERFDVRDAVFVRCGSCGVPISNRKLSDPSRKLVERVNGVQVVQERLRIGRRVAVNRDKIDTQALVVESLA